MNKIKKDGTSVNYFPKATYWRPLVSSAESVVKTTNQSFKNPRAPSVVENKAEFGLV